MTPILTDYDLVKQEYSELKDLCKDLDLDVKFIDMPLTLRKKEYLKTIIPQEPKDTWRLFAI